MASSLSVVVVVYNGVSFVFNVVPYGGLEIRDTAYVRPETISPSESVLKFLQWLVRQR